MLELFMVSPIDQSQGPAAISVLKGLCARAPYESYTRSLRFQGPSRPNGLSNASSITECTFDNRNRPVPPPLWRELQTAVTPQSYLVEARYEIPYEGYDMTRLDEKEGILRWVDFPAPQGTVPKVVQQRKKIEIWGQKNLLKVMQDNNYAFKGELIEHTYQFFDDNHTEYCFLRQLYAAPASNYRSMPVPEARIIQQFLPPLSQLPPIDPMDRWFLHVKVHVLEDNKPDEVRAGHEKLQQVRRDLEGAIAFKEFDRRAWDTRVPVEVRNAPAPLPQVVTVDN